MIDLFIAADALALLWIFITEVREMSVREFNVIFIIGIILGFAIGTTIGLGISGDKVRSALVRQGVGRYVINPQTGETKIEWANINSGVATLSVNWTEDVNP